MALKAEAKSANHFKEVSYKLENKVVELNQAVATLKAEKATSDQRVNQLEAQVKQWTEKYEKTEKESKGSQLVLKEAQTRYETLVQAHENIKAEHTSTLENVKRLTEEVKNLKEQLSEEKAKQQKKEVVKEVVVSNESEVNELKSQIVALKAQLARAMHTRKQSLSPSRNGATSRNVSPSPMRGRQASFSSSEDPLRQTTLLTNRRTRRNSSVDASGAGIKSSIDRIRLAEELSNGKAPRPTSLGIYNASGKNGRLDNVSDDPEAEVNYKNNKISIKTYTYRLRVFFVKRRQFKKKSWVDLLDPSKFLYQVHKILPQIRKSCSLLISLVYVLQTCGKLGTTVNQKTCYLLSWMQFRSNVWYSLKEICIQDFNFFLEF